LPAALTDMQRRFALEYASNGGNATAAAKAAGYSEASAAEIGRQQLRKAHVRKLILEELIRCRTESGAIGLSALKQIAVDVSLPGAARVAAARTLMEHAGLVGPAREVIPRREDAEKADDDADKLVDFNEILEKLAKTGRRHAKRAAAGPDYVK
jgi:phage terminase small subunit